jgi:ethylbenzene dioxygenase beta subunit
MAAEPDPAELRRRVEAFLYREARLLDERRFSEWLALFAPEASYRIPADEEGDPGRVALVDDDRPTLEDRVARAESPLAHCQSPPSRTVHLVGNVEAEAEADGTVRAWAACVVYETRLGRTRALPARVAYRLEPGPGGGWRIREKTVWLLERDLALENLTFLL